jgi:prepilin-type N-terminal cleavage/methylation domain-containing protein
MNIKIANNKGFTFIEIIIVIIVLGILSVFGFHFISTGIHTYSMMEKQKGLFDQATMVMERISRELRDANTIATELVRKPQLTLSLFNVPTLRCKE